MSGYEWDFRAAFLHPELWVQALSVTLGYAVATTVLGLLLSVPVFFLHKQQIPA